MHHAILLAILVCVVAGLTSRLADRFGARPAAPQVAAPSAEPDAAVRTAGPRAVLIPRDASGNFQLEASIGGRRLSFIVDTGASIVTLNSRDAASVGLHPSPSAYTLKLSTANGVVLGAPVRLPAVEVGNILVPNVAAVVLPQEALAKNLLGLTFLSRLRRFEYRDGRLLLEE